MVMGPGYVTAVVLAKVAHTFLVGWASPPTLSESWRDEDEDRGSFADVFIRTRDFAWLAAQGPRDRPVEGAARITWAWRRPVGRRRSGARTGRSRPCRPRRYPGSLCRRGRRNPSSRSGIAST